MLGTFSAKHNHIGGGGISPCDAKVNESACVLTIIALPLYTLRQIPKVSILFTNVYTKTET